MTVGLLLLLFEEPVANGVEFIGVVEGAHVFVAAAILVQDGALSEHDEVDVVSLGQKILDVSILLGRRQLGAPGG